ncbi:MAG: hypothetical protein H2075_04240 [Pseudomonas sp.]|nr:hypothetical protein [Pseudomonas sp.]
MQPGINCLRTILSLPRFQYLVVATLGFYHFTSVRIFVDLDSSLATSTFRRDSSGLTSAGIKQGDHVPQGVVVFGEQAAEFVFKLDFFFQFSVVFEGFEASGLLGDLGFEGFVFGNNRRVSGLSG